jgi:hypothetical protein
MRSAGLQALKEYFPMEFHHEAIKALNDPALMVRSTAVKVLESHLDLATRERLWAEFFHPRNIRKGQSLPIRDQIIQILRKSPQQKELGFWQRAHAENQKNQGSPRMSELTEGVIKKITTGEKL